MTGDPQARSEVLRQIEAEFADRTRRRQAFDPVRQRVEAQLLARTMRSYRDFLAANGLLPLGTRSVLDVGCGRNEFLIACRADWGQHDAALAGIDLMADRVAAGLAAHPYLDLRCGSADRLEWPDAAFDLVHQGMLLTAITDETLRRGIVAEMARVTRPGGMLLWYDFVWNPTNRTTRGISLAELRSYFPGWRLVDHRRVTLAPPLARRLSRWGEPLVALVERLRVLNFWELVLLEKPAA